MITNVLVYDVGIKGEWVSRLVTHQYSFMPVLCVAEGTFSASVYFSMISFYLHCEQVPLSASFYPTLSDNYNI